MFSREVASALERSFFALQAASKGLCGSIALHWPFVTETKILQTFEDWLDGTPCGALMYRVGLLFAHQHPSVRLLIEWAKCLAAGF